MSNDTISMCRSSNAIITVKDVFDVSLSTGAGACGQDIMFPIDTPPLLSTPLDTLTYNHVEEIRDVYIQYVHRLWVRKRLSSKHGIMKR